MTTKQTTTKKTPLKRLISIIAIAIMLFVLAIPCFAWTRLPFEETNNTYCFAFKENTTQRQNFCIYAYSHNGTNWYVSLDGLTFSYLTPDLLSDLVYIPIKTTSPTEAQARQIIQTEINKFNTSIQGEYLDEIINRNYNEGYTEGYEIGQQDGYNWGWDIGYGNGYDDGIDVSYDVGYNNGYADGHAQGETDGLNTGETGKNLILTIFSVPTYVLSNVFNFEIFGINLYSLICFLLTISIVGIVLKKIL